MKRKSTLGSWLAPVSGSGKAASCGEGANSGGPAAPQVAELTLERVSSVLENLISFHAVEHIWEFDVKDYCWELMLNEYFSRRICCKILSP